MNSHKGHSNHPQRHHPASPNTTPFHQPRRVTPVDFFKGTFVTTFKQPATDLAYATVKEIISPYIDDPTYRPPDDGYVGFV